MTPEQFARAEQLFEQACDLEADRRVAFVTEQAADDPEVAGVVRRMLAQDSDAAAQLETPAMGRGFHVGPATELESRLSEEFERTGRFRLIERIGEGGFGSVYRAEQLVPVRRLVAIKVIKPGMDTRSVISRFHAERQTLARMNHPGIATVFDAGVTESGRSYFAMELAEGTPLGAYCSAQRLDVRARIELFLEVCSAVHHAHQKGIIHRDLKPANILVTSVNGVAKPKVIDFGIARAAVQDSESPSLTLEHGQLVGTPEYMSPEQAAGERDIDTRSDIYAMGVILYELVSGVTPFDPRGAGHADLERVLRLIRESDPPAPSTRLKSSGSRADEIARERRTGRDALRRMLRGDVDWIVMKAIEKDRTRRYETINALAEDLGRHLRDEEVLACPPSTRYRFQKFARRHRMALIGGSAIMLALVFGIIGTGIGLVQARQAAQIAQTQASISSAVTEFLTVDLLSSATPDDKGKDVTVRAIVDEAARNIDGRFPESPLVEAGVRFAIGKTYLSLSQLPEADVQLPKALEIRVRLLGAEHPDTLTAAREVGLLRRAQGRLGDAESIFTDVLNRSRRVMGPAHEHTFAVMQYLASVYGQQGRTDDAERAFRELIAQQSAALGNDHPDVVTARSNLIRILQSAGRIDEVGEQLAQTLASQQKTLGPDHPNTLFTRGSVAQLHMQAGRYDLAEPEYTSLIEDMSRVFGPEHAYTMYVMGDFALVLERLKRYSQAESMRLKVLEGLSRTIGENHAETTIAREQLGDLYFRQQQWSRAEPLYIAALAQNQREFGAMHEYTRKSQLRLARTRWRLDRLDEARALLLPLIEFAGQKNDPALREYEIVLGAVLTRQARPKEAEEVLLRALNLADSDKRRDSRDRRDAIQMLVTLYEAQGRSDDAAAMKARLDQ